MDILIPMVDDNESVTTNDSSNYYDENDFESKLLNLYKHDNYLNELDKLNLNEYDCKTILSSLQFMVFEKLNFDNEIKNFDIINYVLNHVNVNRYEVGNVHLIQRMIVHNMIYYFTRKIKITHNLQNIIHDPIFILHINTINWNTQIYQCALHLLLLFDNLECFQLIYNKAISQNIMVSFYDVLFNNNSNYAHDEFFIFISLNIMTFIINSISEYNDKIKIIDHLYDNTSKLIYYRTKMLDLYLDDTIGYISLKVDCNVNNVCGIYKLFKSHELEHIKDKIMTSIIKNNFDNVDKKIYTDYINYMNINPNLFLTDALSCANKYFIDTFIDIPTICSDTSMLFKILSFLVSDNKINAWEIDSFNLTKKIKRQLFCEKYLCMLDDNQIIKLMRIATKYYNNADVIGYIFNRFTKCNTNYISMLDSSRSVHIMQHLLNLYVKNNISLDCNDEQYFHLYINNSRLVICLIGKQLLNECTCNKLLNVLSQNKLNIKNKCILSSKIVEYTIKKYGGVFDQKICDGLYKNKCYDATCTYINLMSNQIHISFDVIKRNYKNIINTRNFKKLLFHLRLTKDDAINILSRIIHTWKRSGYLFIFNNLLHLDVPQLINSLTHI